MVSKLSLAVVALFSIQQAVAHGVVTATTGPNGNKGAGFATIADLDRTQGGGGKAAQVDTTVFPKSKKRQAANPCGKTKAGGQVNIATELAKSEAAGLPDLGADGSATLSVFQINGDGAGPYTMLVSPDEGKTWTNMAVSQNVPGTNGRTKTKTTEFALVGTVPAGTKCAGGADGATCLVMAKNPVGPFGSCTAFTQGGNAAAAAPAKNATVARTVYEAKALAAREAEEAIERALEAEDDAPIMLMRGEDEWEDAPELEFKRSEEWVDAPELEFKRKFVESSVGEYEELEL